MVVASTGAIVARLSAELGLTPSSRSRITMPAADEDEIARRYLS
jgi:phage terminase small subunit